MKTEKPRARLVPSPPWEAGLASNPESTVGQECSAFQVCSFPLSKT